MNSKQTDISHNEVQTVRFCIHKKIKEKKANWSYIRTPDSFTENLEAFLITSLTGEVEHAVYEKCSAGFMLVDFFNNYEQACHQAKEILNNSPALKNCVLFGENLKTPLN